MAKYYAGFLIFGYLAEVGAVAVIDQSRHTERSLLSSLEEAVGWPEEILAFAQRL
ncbi:MAG TPA: hypothetical protein VLL72_04125 [Kiloniellales bacterium]|nr:hypothetical protein [Kiloniellales bacterium]